MNIGDKAPEILGKDENGIACAIIIKNCNRLAMK